MPQVWPTPQVYLTPVPGNDPVPQNERSTRVLGGPGAAMNAQAQALLNRMYYLFALFGPPNVAIRVVDADTTVAALDELIVVTAAAIITLPDAATLRILNIKRSGPGNVTVQPVNGQLIEGETHRILNVNLYSVMIHSDGVGAWYEI